MWDRIALVVWAQLVTGAAAEGQEAERVTAFRGARVLTVNGTDFDPGTLVIQGGKITQVGPAGQVEIPQGAQVHDMSGRVIIPGLVDSHSHLGVYPRPAVPSNRDGNEMTGSVQSAVRALDSVNPFDPGIRMARAGGVTTANIMPGSGNVIGGQTIYVKLRGQTIDQMRVQADGVVGGLKMANGENPKRAYGGKGQPPATRMKVAALQRTEFVRARDYMAQWDAYRRKLAAGAEATAPAVDLGLEPLVEVIERRRTVHFHSHRADDIMTTLRLAEEFGFELVVQHGTEGYQIADLLAARQIPVSMTIVDSPGGKAEVVDFIEECGAQLAGAGVKVMVNTDDSITESRFFLRTAAITVRGGLDEATALRAITLHPAQAMHLAGRLGSLEPGKDADFVVLSGPPFSVYTRVLATYIDGQKVFDWSDPGERFYQTGGFAVPDAGQVPLQADIVRPPAPSVRPASLKQVPPLNASTRQVAVLAGRVHTVSGGTIEDGAVLVREGKIEFVGPRAQLVLPADTPVVTAHEVTPGLIDAYSVVPLAGEYNIPADQDADEATDPNQADVRVLDGFHPAEPLLRYVLQQGVTIIHACPGRANVIAGQTGVFRTHGRTAEAMTVRFPQAILVNLGDQPKTTYREKRPGTRMGTAALVRGALTAAANHQRQQEARQEKDRPSRDLKHEALALALAKKLPVLFVAHRADDLLTAARIAGEFDLRGQLALATEGYLIRDLLAQSRMPVIVHPTMQRVGDLETYHSFLGNAAALADAGCPLALASGVEGYVPKTRVVRYEAAMAMVYGLGYERALRSITLDSARILGIDDRFGSLERGKVADLVLYDGDPFEHTTHVTGVLLGGRMVYDRSEERKIPFARRALFASPEVPCCMGW